MVFRAGLSGMDGPGRGVRAGGVMRRIGGGAAGPAVLLPNAANAMIK